MDSVVYSVQNSTSQFSISSEDNDIDESSSYVDCEINIETGMESVLSSEEHVTELEYSDAIETDVSSDTKSIGTDKGKVNEKHTMSEKGDVTYEYKQSNGNENNNTNAVVKQPYTTIITKEIVENMVKNIVKTQRDTLINQSAPPSFLERQTEIPNSPSLPIFKGRQSAQLYSAIMAMQQALQEAPNPSPNRIHQRWPTSNMSGYNHVPGKSNPLGKPDSFKSNSQPIIMNLSDFHYEASGQPSKSSSPKFDIPPTSENNCLPTLTINPTRYQIAIQDRVSSVLESPSNPNNVQILNTREPPIMLGHALTDVNLPCKNIYEYQ